MELWIRSQDKFDLVPINNPISILKDEWFEGLEKQYQKYNLTYNGKKLGVYNSLEKALEVLDEIHQRLINLATIEIAPDSYIVLPKDTSNVYEMPQR